MSWSINYEDWRRICEEAAAHSLGTTDLTNHFYFESGASPIWKK